jgi:Sel1 repeat
MGLQIKLVGRLGRDKFHRRALHCFGDRFRIAIVFLVTFAIRPHVFRRHQLGVVAKRLKFATEMMRPGAGLHADEARRQVDKPRFHLATRPLLAQHQGSTDDVERILADIDADHGDFAVEFLGHGVLLCLRCPLPVSLAGRAGARPDHPILGLGVPRDPDKAIELYKKAAAGDVVLAELRLGKIYMHGDLAPPDFTLAMSYLQKAAYHGDPRAAMLLGQMYRLGMGTDVDVRRAYAWARRRARPQRKSSPMRNSAACARAGSTATHPATVRTGRRLRTYMAWPPSRIGR